MKEAARAMGIQHSTNGKDKIEDIDSFLFGLEAIYSDMIAQLLEAEDNVVEATGGEV